MARGNFTDESISSSVVNSRPAGRPVVDRCVKEFKQANWISFPWDIANIFAIPTKDGGRSSGGAE